MTGKIIHHAMFKDKVDAFNYAYSVSGGKYKGTGSRTRVYEDTRVILRLVDGEKRG